MDNVEKRIIEVLEKIRPFLNSDGGDIKFIKFIDGVVFVELTGHCSNCFMMDTTLKDGIEVTLINEIPEVIEVRNISSID